MWYGPLDPDMNLAAEFEVEIGEASSKAVPSIADFPIPKPKSHYRNASIGVTLLRTPTNEISLMSKLFFVKIKCIFFLYH